METLRKEGVLLGALERLRAWGNIVSFLLMLPPASLWGLQG